MQKFDVQTSSRISFTNLSTLTNKLYEAAAAEVEAQHRGGFPNMFASMNGLIYWGDTRKTESKCHD